MWDLVLSPVINPQDWYEKHELLEAARKEGYRVTDHQFKDWVDQGLLAQNKELGRKIEALGRGHGSKSMWSSEQRSLFFELLQGRQQKPSYPIGHLCVFPAWRWIYLGEQLGGVGLPQVRRMMNTWVTFRKKTSLDWAQKQAHATLRILQGEHASETRAALKELTKLYTFNKKIDAESLEYLLQPVMTHPHLLHFEGDREEVSIDAKRYAYMLELVNKSYQQYEQIADLDDVFWEWARIMVLYGHTIEQSSNVRNILDASSRFTVYDSLQASLCDLIAWLSKAVWERKQHENLSNGDPDSFGSVLSLRAWQEKKVTYQIETTYAYSDLLRPDGSNNICLRNNVHLYLTDQEKKYDFTLNLPFL
jgi:hypothetical protein